MAPGIDNSGFSGLLCVEDNVSVFFDENEDAGSSGAMWRRRSSHQDHVFASVREEDGLSLQSEECVSQLLHKEHQHMPNCNYVNRLRNGDLDACARKEAIDWIIKVHSHFRFGPLCAYLSVSYLDRFLSSYDLPKGIGWMIQLLAVSCLSLAAKVEEIDVPLSLDLQVGESKYIFEARTVQRMELLVLSKLCWRMQAVTPFSFLDHFLTKINNGGDGNPPPKNAIQMSIRIISSTIGAIDLLEFKPSEIAAAVAMSVVEDTETVDAKVALLSLSQHVQKERVEECLKVIHSLVSTSGSSKATTSVASIPQSPIGVLDITCFSYKSDETAVGSFADSSQNNNSGSKRRKIDRQTL